MYCLVFFPPHFLHCPCPLVFVFLNLLTIGMESLIEKVSFEKVSSTKSRILWFLVSSYQGFEKCFSVPAIGTFRTLFEENNIFLSMGEHFLISTLSSFLELNSCWRSFSLKNVYLTYLCWLVFVCWRNLLLPLWNFQ